MPNRGPTLTVRPWDARDGDPGRPERVLGVRVDRPIITRPDAAGALVALEDHRVALTGPTVAIGRHEALRSYARSRARALGDRPGREWLTQVAVALERMYPRDREVHRRHLPPG
jgi:hypothetical protein